MPIELEGLIEPSLVVDVSSPVDGLIEESPVDRGDFVKRGQVVAMLESSVEKATQAIARQQTQNVAAIKSSKRRWEYSTRLHEHNKPLFDQGIISIEELDQTETDRDLAELANIQAVGFFWKSFLNIPPPGRAGP